jgi:hypothetical protein
VSTTTPSIDAALTQLHGIEPALIALLPSLSVAILTAIVTVRLALRRFRSERWWERKAETYSQIVEAMVTIIEFCERISQHPDKEERDQLIKECEASHRKLRRLTIQGEFVIGSRIAEILNLLLKRDPMKEWDHTIWTYEEWERDTFQNALAQVRFLVKKDLRI